MLHTSLYSKLQDPLNSNTEPESPPLGSRLQTRTETKVDREQSDRDYAGIRRVLPALTVAAKQSQEEPRFNEHPVPSSRLAELQSQPRSLYGLLGQPLMCSRDFPCAHPKSRESSLGPEDESELHYNRRLMQTRTMTEVRRERSDTDRMGNRYRA